MPIQIPHLHLHHHRHAQPPPQPRLPPQSHHPKSNLSESGTRKLLFLLLKCIIMTFILSLFLLFIGFAALVLLHFLLLTTTTSAGRRRRRRRGQRQALQYYSVSDHNFSPYSLKDVEDFVPSLSYDAAGESVKDCAICLETFKDGENCRKLLGCNHLFHVICVDSWLIKVPNCPVCRNRVKLDSARVVSIDSEDDWRVWWPVGG